MEGVEKPLRNTANFLFSLTHKIAIDALLELLEMPRDQNTSPYSSSIDMASLVFYTDLVLQFWTARGCHYNYQFSTVM